MSSDFNVYDVVGHDKYGEPGLLLCCIRPDTGSDDKVRGAAKST